MLSDELGIVRSSELVVERMNKLEFLVQGSAAEPYLVTFLKDGTNLSAYCTCPAGENGQYCKHRFGLLAGSRAGLQSGNEGDLTVLASWLPNTDLEAALSRLARAEAAYEVAKKGLTRAKKEVAKAMRD